MSDGVTLPGTGTKIAAQEIDSYPGGTAFAQGVQFALQTADGSYVGDPFSLSVNMPVIAVQNYDDAGINIDGGVPTGRTAAINDVVLIGDINGSSQIPHLAQSLQLKHCIIVDKDHQNLKLKMHFMRSTSLETQDTAYTPADTEVQRFIADTWTILDTDWEQFGTGNSFVRHNFHEPDGYCWAASPPQVGWVMTSNASQVISGAGSGFDIVLVWGWV